ncbi:Tim44/TimA family putative adaptor protein [Bombella saccharophila]|uniref:Tim44/TimA family putative adaptor protein n=1 Tax=Bombella saccharophila TaxID=2967338 RepID=A0ABT3W8A6_9PROT|nr:Tim44/TimA family putative adaptor protein [Bombella saccharophila]MCX5613949.1 Tim44/TimA family putative adaptor protein [Bombella saccharophila]
MHYAFPAWMDDLGHTMVDFPWDIVVWAVVAVIIGSAVFFVLGRRMGAQAFRRETISSSLAVRASKEASSADALKPPPLPNRVGPEQKVTEYGIPTGDSALAQSLGRVGDVVSGFSAEFFLKKAEDVFARTVKAFACADRSMLASVLAPELLEHFTKVLDERAERHEQVHLELRQIERLEYIFATGDKAEEGPCQLGVRIISWQVSYCRDEKGTIVEGTEALTEFRDCWTFEYDMKGQWKIVATRAD